MRSHSTSWRTPSASMTWYIRAAAATRGSSRVGGRCRRRSCRPAGPSERRRHAIEHGIPRMARSGAGRQNSRKRRGDLSCVLVRIDARIVGQADDRRQAVPSAVRIVGIVRQRLRAASAAGAAAGSRRWPSDICRLGPGSGDFGSRPAAAPPSFAGHRRLRLGVGTSDHELGCRDILARGAAGGGASEGAWPGVGVVLLDHLAEPLHRHAPFEGVEPAGDRRDRRPVLGDVRRRPPRPDRAARAPPSTAAARTLPWSPVSASSMSASSR